jgi:ABC-type sugar transport system ATPase subunit
MAADFYGQGGAMETVLEMRGISKTFPGVRALDGVNLTLHAGEVHGLMGENGAGKSTLMKILLGIYTADEGSITLFGKPVSFRGPREAIAGGICMIHQELNLIPEMTIAENIFLGREPLKNGFVDYKRINRDTRELLEKLNLSMDPTMKLGRLTVAGQQMVEIAKGFPTIRGCSSWTSQPRPSPRRRSGASLRSFAR